LIFDVLDFIFRALLILLVVRCVLIKPSASYPLLYPATTSRHLLATIIKGIRRVSDADIILLEGTPSGAPVYPVYKALDYQFPRVLTLDVKDCTWVEVDNPLVKPLAVPTFWIPNVILSSDYLISATPLKVSDGKPWLSIMNLLTVLPSQKYETETQGGWSSLYDLGIDKVITDLYFTLPFDVGIIEAREILPSTGDSNQGKITEYGKVFVGEPYEVDSEVSESLRLKTEYLDLIKTAKKESETNKSSILR